MNLVQGLRIHRTTVHLACAAFRRAVAVLQMMRNKKMMAVLGIADMPICQELKKHLG
jgi:hypothetical protein